MKKGVGDGNRLELGMLRERMAAMAAAVVGRGIRKRADFRRDLIEAAGSP
jgi:hypothetical protein